jgi:peptide/nickel transport system substrate-binding protein
MRRLPVTVLLPLAAVLAVVVVGCGGGGGKAKKGGTLTVINLSDVDSLDPGYWYYQTDYQDLFQTTQRGLYGWEASKTTPSPDLATEQPKVTNGGKTVTVKIQKGIKYSAPLQNRTVKAADIKYAMERCFDPKIGNGYAGSYYSDIKGFDDVNSGKAKEASGIQTPDDQTIVFQLNRPVGVITIPNALSLPCTVPVPKDYAAKYDKGKTSTYGQYQVFTGPYMIPNNSKGKLTGYKPGKRIELVRNPSWDKSTDFRPANLDKIVVDEGNDSTVGSRKVLSGRSMINGDYAAPPPAVLKQALSRYKSQVSITPSQGNRYVSFNTQKPPFDDVNVRKAVIAATDRTALRLTRGGESLGPLATHFIPPGIPGFEEAGGTKGPGFDFQASPTANLPLAQQYMKKAGFKSGKYTGPKLLMVGDNQPPASKTGEAFQGQLAKLGFKLNYRQVPHETMISKFCGTEKNHPELCPNFGWAKDFYDAQSMIDPIYNGKNIAPTGNVNTALVDDPKVNAAIDKAKVLIDAGARAKAWGAIDKYVTGQAYYDVWLWDDQINIASKNVKVVLSKFNTSADLTYTSLK